MLFFAQTFWLSPANSIFPIISYLQSQWDVLFGKERGGGGWFWRSGEKWGDGGGMRQGEPGPQWTTKGPVSQRQLHAGGEGSQERPWLGPGPAHSTRTSSTLTALGRKQHAAAAPSRHRGQDWITNYTSTQLVYLRLDRKDRHTLWVQCSIYVHHETRTHRSPAALRSLWGVNTNTQRWVSISKLVINYCLCD